MAIHYPLYVQRPESMDVTREQFDHFSYMGMAAFWISWPMAISRQKDGDLRIYMPDCNLYPAVEWPRLKGLKFGRYPEAEMGFVIIPKDHVLHAKIERYFKKYFFLQENQE